MFWGFFVLKWHFAWHLADRLSSVWRYPHVVRSFILPFRRIYVSLCRLQYLSQYDEAQIFHTAKISINRHHDTRAMAWYILFSLMNKLAWCLGSKLVVSIAVGCGHLQQTRSGFNSRKNVGHRQVSKVTRLGVNIEYLCHPFILAHCKI